jgi:HAD superfamily hydrolase (TIGR01458 family)
MSNEILDISKFRGFLIDLDGVMYYDDEVLPFAKDFIGILKDSGKKYIYATNTTTKSPDEIKEKIMNLGIDSGNFNIISPVIAAKQYLEKRSYSNVRLVINESLLPVFEKFTGQGSPNAILISDIGDKWDYELMSSIFDDVMSGAEIIALHKGKYWKTGGKNRLDIGAFVAGIEYAASVKAKIMGKPESGFFNAAFEILELKPNECVMLGDDIESDIEGAMNCGIAGCLVKTGKKIPDDFDIEPDYVIESLKNFEKFL